MSSLAALAVFSAFTACGSSSGSPADDDTIGTLAYVQSSCEESGGEFRFSQSLRILHDGEERTILELSLPTAPLPGIGLCFVFGRNRDGKGSLFVGALQRVGVSPAGERVVFEVTDDFSATHAGLLNPEEEGIFSVGADGTGLKRIAAASRYANSTIVSADPVYAFSADGETIAFADLGPGPDGEEEGQIFLLELETGVRTQLTRLPRSERIGYPRFLADGSVGFLAVGQGIGELYTVPLTGGEVSPIPPLTSVPGGAVVPSFQITGERFTTYGDFRDSQPTNPGNFSIQREVFVSDGANSLQITSFNRSDTARFGTILSVDGERVFFTASIDLGDNPAELCQVFSASVLGGDVRQLTRFSQERRSLQGCPAFANDGCSTGLSFGADSADARTGTVIFDSSCDPFGTNPNGEQIFAVRPDGTGLRQLTHAHEFVRGPDGSASAELPGPWAYGPHN